MRIFIAGATGVIGRRLVPALIAHGHHVIALARRDVHIARAEIARADVYDAAALTRAVAAAKPDVVMHQLTDLGAGDRAANARIRGEGTRHLITAARAAGVRRVIAQSVSWAYAPGAEPALESEPLDVEAGAPRSSTVRGVSELEQQIAGMPEFVVLRYGLFYGPGTWYAHNGLHGQSARDGKLIADADVSSFVHLDDAASAAIAALTWPSGAVNVCDDEPATGFTWLPEFCRAVGAPEPQRGGAPRQAWARGANNRLARSRGWTPRYASWRSGFADL